MDLDCWTDTMPTLETPRLLLRPLQSTDAEDIFAYARDPEVGPRAGWLPHETLADTLAYLDLVEDWLAGGTHGVWGIVVRAYGRVCGTIDLTVAPEHRRAETGYALGRRWWGQGFMSEALETVLRFGFEALGLHRIQACCFGSNLASARVLQKVGMREEGVFRDYLFRGDGYEDMRHFAILRPEWEAWQRRAP